MRFICLLITLQFLGADLRAQVTPAEIRREPFNERGIYRFASFEEGKVYFRNGNTNSSRLNYNIALDEIHFIAKNGDTLSIEEPASIKFITLHGERFYYDKGYLQSLLIAGDLILAFKQVIITEQKKETVYDVSTDGPVVKTYNFFSQNGQQYIMGGTNDHLLFSAREYYFFGDSFGNFFRANKEYLYQHYYKNQADVRDFLRKNHTNFNNVEDLAKLLQYCVQL